MPFDEILSDFPRLSFEEKQKISRIYIYDFVANQNNKEGVVNNGLFPIWFSGFRSEIRVFGGLWMSGSFTALICAACDAGFLFFCFSGERLREGNKM